MSSPARPLRLQLVLSALALVLIGGNLLAFVRGYDNVPPREHALEYALYDTFMVYHLFMGAATQNQVAFVEGLPEAGGDWIELDLSELIPRRRGEQLLRVWAWRHQHLQGEEGARAARAGTARRIRERYNRLHPGQPLARVRLGLESWPGDTPGFQDRRDESARSILYSEP